jgi:hypothetical protein
MPCPLSVLGSGTIRKGPAENIEREKTWEKREMES